MEYVELLRELIKSGKATATDRDPQNITTLHWAAINAHVAACRYLLKQGVEVDALGGDLVATSKFNLNAMGCYIFVIQLFIMIAHIYLMSIPGT
jgi:ankyrin repeat protein